MSFEQATPRKMSFLDKLFIWLIKNPVVVYTPGKVGSSSIVNSLRSLGVDEVQPHSLRYSNPGVYFVLAPSTCIQRLYYSLKSVLLRVKTMVYKCCHVGRKVKIVSLIRSPAERNISAFFEHFHHLGLGEINDFTAQELADLFFLYGDYDAQERWLREELKAVFGIDLYETLSFEVGKPVTLSRGNVQLFFLRMEDLNGCFNELKLWLGLSRLTLIPTNRSEYKEYAVVYKDAKSIIMSSAEYMWAVENTHFYKTFYSFGK
jgi:hypothetical protein